MKILIEISVEKATIFLPLASSGSSCVHGREKRYCKKCGECKICVYGRERRYCKDCGGSRAA
jgi:hypothetical protein